MNISNISIHLPFNMGGMQHDLIQGSLDGMLANISCPFQGNCIPEISLVYHETYVTNL